MAQISTFSFRDLVGALAHPFIPAGIILMGGNVGGIVRATVTMAADQTVHNVAADGSVMVSGIQNDSGRLELECQQTSVVHQELLSLYNALNTAKKLGDVVDWAAMTITLQNVADGSKHTFQGCSFTKVPDKGYESEGKTVTWAIMAAEVINE